MSVLLLPAILEIGKQVLDRVLPNEEAKRAGELELLKKSVEGDFKQVLAQLQINAQEAMHPSIWVAGWRPGFGWAGVVSFVYATMLQPMLTWLATIKGWPLPPVIDTELLLYVAGTMLGIGGMRTFEKKHGVTK
jgi:hypothetical protein